MIIKNVLFHLCISASILIGFNCQANDEWVDIFSLISDKYSLVIQYSFDEDSVKFIFTNKNYINLVSQKGIQSQKYTILDTIKYDREPNLWDIDHLMTRYYQVIEPSISVYKWSKNYSTLKYYECFYNLTSIYQMARENELIYSECMSEDCRVKGLVLNPIGESFFIPKVNLSYEVELFRLTTDSIIVREIKVIDYYTDVDTTVSR